MDHRHLKELAAHWRALAMIGDPMSRDNRQKWADELDRLAKAEEALVRDNATQRE